MGSQGRGLGLWRPWAWGRQGRGWNTESRPVGGGSKGLGMDRLGDRGGLREPRELEGNTRSGRSPGGYELLTSGVVWAGPPL